MSIKSDQSPGLDGGPGADKDYFQYLKAVVKGRNDPVWFAREILGVDLFPVQEELLREFYQDLYDPSKPQRKVFILEAGMRPLSGNTLVSTENGLEYIKDICSNNPGEYECTGELKTRYGYKDTTQYVMNKDESTTILTTRTGYSIEGTGDHPVLVMNNTGNLEWKDIAEVKCGDYLCISRNKTEIKHSHIIENTKLARYLGLLVGDGSYPESHINGHTFTTGDNELKDEYIELSSELFNYEPYIIYDTRTTNTHTLYTYSKSIREELLSYGLTYSISYNKSVPSYIMHGSEGEIIAFLSGLFDTDGYILKGGKSVHLDMTSERCVNEVQQLLLLFGIVSTRRKKKVKYQRKTGENSYCWTLTLYGKNIELFNKYIGFRLARKQLEYTIIPRPSIDKIPNLHDILIEMRSNTLGKYPDIWQKIRRQCYGSLRKTTDKPSGITYWILDKIIDYFDKCDIDTSYLKHLRHLNLYYDEVVSIENGKNDVYCFRVPDVGEFLANGIVVKNSGKTALASIIACFEFFLLITMEDPAGHYGLLRKQPIFISVVATSSKIAEDGVFQNTINMLEGSDWFQTWFPEIHPTGEKIEYKTKTCHVAVRYLGSWANTAVGRTNKCVIMDELDLFEDTNGKRGAWEMWTRLRKSTATLHRDGHVMGLSSPKRANGIIRTLRLNGEREPDMCLARMYKTWEMNPNITDEELREEFKNDMASYYRDFACQPEIAGGLQFPEKVVLTPMINVLTAESYVDNKRVSRVMAIDPAVKNDGFGVACGYMDTYGNIVIDGVFKFTKKEGDAYIKPSDVRAFIYEKIPKLMVNEFIFDTWMFPDIIEDLKTKFGIEATKHIVRKEDYDRWRGMQTNPGTTKLTVVDDDDLEREANTLIVTRTESGIPKTDHVYGGSKDCADCVANVIWYLVTGGDDKDKKVKIPRLVAIQAF